MSGLMYITTSERNMVFDRTPGKDAQHVGKAQGEVVGGCAEGVGGGCTAVIGGSVAGSMGQDPVDGG